MRGQVCHEEWIQAYRGVIPGKKIIKPYIFLFPQQSSILKQIINHSIIFLIVLPDIPFSRFMQFIIRVKQLYNLLYPVFINSGINE
jgi:hypothetical protein